MRSCLLASRRFRRRLPAPAALRLPAHAAPTHPLLPPTLCRQIANLILAGQCLQSIYQLYCGADCGVRKCVWQFVAGGALLILAQVRCFGGCLAAGWLVGGRAGWRALLVLLGSLPGADAAAPLHTRLYPCSPAAFDGPHGGGDAGE